MEETDKTIMDVVNGIIKDKFGKLEVNLERTYRNRKLQYGKNALHYFVAGRMEKQTRKEFTILFRLKTG